MEKGRSQKSSFKGILRNEERWNPRPLERSLRVESQTAWTTLQSCHSAPSGKGESKFKEAHELGILDAVLTRSMESGFLEKLQQSPTRWNFRPKEAKVAIFEPVNMGSSFQQEDDSVLQFGDVSYKLRVPIEIFRRELAYLAEGEGGGWPEPDIIERAFHRRLQILLRIGPHKIEQCDASELRKLLSYIDYRESLKISPKVKHLVGKITFSTFCHVGFCPFGSRELVFDTRRIPAAIVCASVGETVRGTFLWESEDKPRWIEGEVIETDAPLDEEDNEVLPVGKWPRSQS